MNKLSTPEYHGYVTGQNIVPYINKCIELTNECNIGPGEHIVGRNDSNWWTGNIWGDNCIQWGWSKKHGVKITGAGRGKTVLKFVNNVQSARLFDKEADSFYMLQTNYYESCNDTVISGITFDGNYKNNSSRGTSNAIRIRGENTTIKNCKFINFGVGKNQKAECFYIAVGPVTKMGVGPTIIDNVFTQMGGKMGSPAGFVPEQSLIAFGGKNAVVSRNYFFDCKFHPSLQQSPLHGITLGETENALISENVFYGFMGQCIYNDSFTNKNAKIVKNRAIQVFNFLQLTCQKWNDPTQITYNEGHNVSNNLVILTNAPAYSQWDKQPGVSSFFGYIHQPGLNKALYPGFKNILVENNQIFLGEQILTKTTRKYSDLLVCYWGSAADKSQIEMKNNTVIDKNRLAYANALNSQTSEITKAMKAKDFDSLPV